MSPVELSAEISRIGALDLSGLREIWEQRYGASPTLRSAEILRRLLAWRIQAEDSGGLDRLTRRLLARKRVEDAEGFHLGVGARLTRIWNGREVEVIVENDGFRCDGRLFASLSAAATAIAGSRWNGPRFFGLRARA